jgi:transcriptional repressor NF-X1
MLTCSGATINCQYACARPPPPCGHPKTAHPCHESESCPPCPYLTTRACACGKDPAVKHVRCSQDRVSCGQICGTLLPCGFHTCDKSCHKPGECDPCAQTCNKPKRICRHPCTAQCHAPTRCPENDPCQYLVMQTCACGNLQSRTSCGASVSGQSRESTQLKCNSECAIKQRNARLADALGINQGDRGLVEWNTDLKEFASANLGFVKMVESTFKDFFAGQRQTLILPHMPPSKRTFVVGLADVYRLGRELIDQEPNRSVQIRRRIDTRIPNPLLSSTVSPPTTAKLANLRTTTPVATPAPTPWAKPSTPALTPNSTHLNLASLAISQSQAEASGSSARGSRPVTPAPPVLEVKGKVGEVDEVDWDED